MTEVLVWIVIGSVTLGCLMIWIGRTAYVRRVKRRDPAEAMLRSLLSSREKLMGQLGELDASKREVQGIMDASRQRRAQHETAQREIERLKAELKGLDVDTLLDDLHREDTP